VATGINDIVTVTATDAARTLSAPGFGRSCFLGYFPTSIFPENYRIYTDPDGMISDGFDLNDPVYLMAASAFNQNPRPVDVMIGRLPAAHTHTQVLTITSAVEGRDRGRVADRSCDGCGFRCVGCGHHDHARGSW
jgi:hypothetical protein